MVKIIILKTAVNSIAVWQIFFIFASKLLKQIINKLW